MAPAKQKGPKRIVKKSSWMNYLASVRPDMLKNGTTPKDCMKKASEKWKEMDTKAKAKFDTTE